MLRFVPDYLDTNIFILQKLKINITIEQQEDKQFNRILYHHERMQTHTHTHTKFKKFSHIKHLWENIFSKNFTFVRFIHKFVFLDFV